MITPEFFVSEEEKIIMEKRGGMYRYIGYFNDHGHIVRGPIGDWNSETKTMRNMKWSELKEL